MMPTWCTILLSVLAALATGSGVSWFLIRANQRKLQAEKRKIDAEARAVDKAGDADYAVKVTVQYDKLADRLARQVDELTKRQEAVDIERAAEHQALLGLQAEVVALRLEVAGLKIENGILRDALAALKAAA